MRAVVYDRYGPPEVLHVESVPRPVPRAGEVLVRVRAAGVSAGDWHLLVATYFAVRLFQGLLRPRQRVLGFELSGRVEAVGAGVTELAPGDEVFGTHDRGGCFAEYACISQDLVVRRPPGVGPLEAAAVGASGVTALQALVDAGRVRAGESVLVNGASGGVGHLAVQLAAHLGARVVGVSSAAKADLVRGLGAERVLDHAVDDFTERPERYDLVVDLVGNRSIGACRRALTPNGRYVALAGAPLRTLRAALLHGRRVTGMVATPRRADLQFLAERLERGELRPVVERSFPLEQAGRALEELGAGRVRGKLALAVAGDGELTAGS